jgi:hypothetical protein
MRGVHTTHSPPGGEGGGGSIFWKTRDIGLSSYSNNLFTVDAKVPVVTEKLGQSESFLSSASSAE